MRLVPSQGLVASSRGATSPCDWSLRLVAGTSRIVCADLNEPLAFLIEETPSRLEILHKIPTKDIVLLSSANSHWSIILRPPQSLKAMLENRACIFQRNQCGEVLVETESICVFILIVSKLLAKIIH